MAGVIPPNYTIWSSRGTPSYRSGEGHLVFTGRLQNTPGNIPVIFCHGFALSIPLLYDDLRDAKYVDDFQSVAGGARIPVIASDMGGASTWGIDAVVTSGGAVDDLIAWANNPATAPDAIVTGAPVFGTRTDKVALFGESMGCLNALGWAWRNPSKVAAIVLRAPVVALDAFHDRNSGTFGAIIESAYGGLSAYNAALPTHDPMQNLDLIRPFGHRIQLWAGTDDEFIPPAEVQAFAELVGAEYNQVPGMHADLVNTTPPDQIGFFFFETIRSKQHTFIQWEPTDWGRFDETLLTTVTGAPTNTYDYSTIIGERGRRGVQTALTGSQANDRRVFLWPTDEFSAVDMEIYSPWYSGDTAVNGQQGHAHRVFLDPVAHTYRICMSWQNVFFGIPWIMNTAVWTGTLGQNDLVLNGMTSATLAGLRLASGGLVLASSRVGGIATYQVSEGHRVRVGDLIDVTGTASLDAVQLVTAISPNSFSFPLAGGDVVSGGDGTYGNQRLGFPYQVRSRVYNVAPTVMEVKAWPFGYDEPAYGDPNWSLTWTDPGSFAYHGYGRAGFLGAHLVGAGQRLHWGGPVTAIEL